MGLEWRTAADIAARRSAAPITLKERTKMGLDVSLDKEPCPTCNHAQEGFWANITHNLGAMAQEAGIYQHLWRPEEMGIVTAEQLILPLRNAISAMKRDPERFKKHNPDNGWGSYDVFVPWLEKYLEACERMPMARVSVSR